MNEVRLEPPRTAMPQKRLHGCKTAAVTSSQNIRGLSMRPARRGTQAGLSAADIIITRTDQTAALLSLLLNSNLYF